MRTYSVYVHVNKANGKKYYGMTLQKPERRWGRNGNKYKSNHAFREAIEQYGWDGFAHIVLARDLSFAAAFQLEQACINRDDATNPEKGYNRVIGTYPTREECYRKISLAKMGHSVSQSTRETLRLSAPKRAVSQYSRSGNHIQTFPSITAAADSVNMHKTHVCAACRGRKQTAGGYVWRYAASGSAQPTGGTV